MSYYLVTFSNTHTAIAAQKFLKDRISYYVMPTLREISNSCGISLKIVDASLSSIRSELSKFEVDPQMYTIYQINKDGSIEKMI